MKYTIIITVYNKEKYIKKCIESAANQTLKNYKVVIVNDGSTDKSERIIKNLQKKHEFEYYKKKNTGIADTRNYAISKVKTKYFLFLDADDYLDEKLLETVDKYKDYDVLSFNALNLNEQLKVIKKITKPCHIGNGKEYFSKLIKHKSEFTVPWGYIYNTNYFKKNKFKYPKGKILEDFYLTPFIIIDSKRIISIDYIGYYYVSNDNSIINGNQDKITRTYLEHYETMKKDILNSKYNNKMKKTFISFIAGILVWQGGNIKGNAQKEYIKIIKNKKVINELNPLIKRIIMKVLYNLNIYYPLKKIIKK